ncbi:sterigmatocystin biosynthesis P450 monooxygenase StcS [Xylariales sp. PMI_506]|nr:sterigmatocystin biosynthesis P450 monooxygenase StcS [Xylariales sp. PMI_506]
MTLIALSPNTSIAKPLALSVAVLLLTLLSRFLYAGIATRRRFRTLRNQGIPTLEPHSIIFGHLKLLQELKTGLPSDAAQDYVWIRIIQNWQTYFPVATECPPVIYLDLWPIMSEPIILVVDPQCAAQMTQETPRPRHPALRWMVKLFTNNLDMLSAPPAQHRVWRSLMFTGFSTKNMIANMPGFVEEMTIFAEQFKALAGKDGAWGDMFTVHEKAVSLTFDVIIRIALDLRGHEQTSGPGELRQALREEMKTLRFPNLRSRLQRMMWSFRRNAARNSKITRDILIPQIRSRLHSSGDISSQKTVVDLAIKEMRRESGKDDHNGLNLEIIDKDFMDTIIAQVKVFMFAGHETTALAICWLFWEISKYPEVLKQLRLEHDKVLGPDSTHAAEVLNQTPHKLNDLRYTTAVVKESLRVHNIALTAREGGSDFQFTVGRNNYPTNGFMLQTSVQAMNHRPDIWPRPTEFLPERFLVPEGHELHPVKNAFRPFELGNNNCIGMELAMTELKLSLVFVVRELDFDFNYAAWYQSRNITAEPPTINGEPAYLTTNRDDLVKSGLPARVRLRSPEIAIEQSIK